MDKERRQLIGGKFPEIYEEYYRKNMCYFEIFVAGSKGSVRKKIPRRKGYKKKRNFNKLDKI